jgi:hypothetical protein
MKVVIFEPLLLVTIGRTQANATALVSDKGYGTQPLVSLRWHDPFFDGSYGFTPEC